MTNVLVWLEFMDLYACMYRKEVIQGDEAYFDDENTRSHATTEDRSISQG